MDPLQNGHPAILPVGGGTPYNETRTPEVEDGPPRGRTGFEESSGL